MSIRVVRALAVLLPVMALGGAVVLSLLGYGVAAAIESTFGVPREFTYNSPLGLLNLASHAIAGWMEILVSLGYSEKFRQFAFGMAAIGAVVTIIFFIFRFKINRRKRVVRRGGSARLVGDSSFVRVMVCCARWVFKERLSFTPLVFFSIVPWVFIALAIFVLVSFAVVPVVGYSSATKYFHSWIVAADYCVPLSSRKERLLAERVASDEKNSSKVRITTCLSLWKNGEFVVEGRHVAATDKHIVLFDPVTGGVRIEPLDGVSIRLSGDSATKLQSLIEEAAAADK